MSDVFTTQEIEKLTLELQCLHYDDYHQPGYVPTFHYLMKDSRTDFNDHYLNSKVEELRVNALGWNTVKIEKLRFDLPIQKERAKVQFLFPVSYKEPMELMIAYQYLSFAKVFIQCEHFCKFDIQICSSIYSKRINPKIPTFLRFAPELHHITKEQEIQYPNLWDDSDLFDFEMSDDEDFWTWLGLDILPLSWNDWENRDYWKKILKIS